MAARELRQQGLNDAEVRGASARTRSTAWTDRAALAMIPGVARWDRARLTPASCVADGASVAAAHGAEIAQHACFLEKAVGFLVGWP